MTYYWNHHKSKYSHLLHNELLNHLLRHRLISHHFPCLYPSPFSWHALPLPFLSSSSIHSPPAQHRTTSNVLVSPSPGATWTSLTDTVWQEASSSELKRAGLNVDRGVKFSLQQQQSHLISCDGGELLKKWQKSEATRCCSIQATSWLARTAVSTKDLAEAGWEENNSKYK